MPASQSGEHRRIASTELSALHESVLNGDRTALNALAAIVLPVLVSRLIGRFKLPHDAICNAVEDAVLEYGKRPHAFDPSRNALDRYLYCLAWRNACDLQRAHTRRELHDKEVASLSAIVLQHPRPSYLTCDIEAVIDLDAIAPDANERLAVDVWLFGENRLEQLAAALGLSMLPIATQRREVKRFKDRVIKRASRLYRTSASSATDEVELRVPRRTTRWRRCLC